MRNFLIESLSEKDDFNLFYSCVTSKNGKHFEFHCANTSSQLYMNFGMKI